MTDELSRATSLPDDLEAIAESIPPMPRGLGILRQTLALLPPPLGATLQPSFPADELTPPEQAVNTMAGPGPGMISGASITPGSVSGVQIAQRSIDMPKMRTGVRPIQIVDALPALPDPLYPPAGPGTEGSVVLLTTDGQLYRNVGDVWTKAVEAVDVTGLTDAIIAEAIPVVGALPALPDINYPIGRVVYLTTDGKLYRNVADAWSKATDGADIVANSITGGKIAAGTITATNIAALTITGAEIAAGTITGGKIAANTITAANIAANTITAGEIAAGAIGTSELVVGAVFTGQVINDDGAGGALGTVTISSAGILIQNGALILEDEFGKTVMEASGFSGSWRTFIALGLYNGDYDEGTLGALPNGRTASLPYWTISTVTGNPVLTLVDSVGSPGERYLKFTWAANGDKKRVVSDPVPVAIISQIAYGVLQFGTGTSTQTVEVAIEFSDDLVSWSSSDSTSYAATPINRRQEGVATASGHFARLQITVDETTGHDAAALVAIFTAWIKPAATIAAQLLVEDRLTLQSPAGAGLASIDLDGMLRFEAGVGIGASAAGVLEIDDGTGITPGSGGTAALVVQGAVYAAQDGSDNAFFVGDDAILFDADTADTVGIKGQQTAANGKIVFGSGKDTNLYRSAANELKTDDAFVVGGAYIGGATPPVVRVYTSTAGTTWNKPTGLRFLVVECWGGGGGGGGAATTGATTTSGGGGGGGGGYAKKVFDASALPASCTADAGTAGAGGSGNAAGTAGGATTFSGTGITTVQGNGGSGGESGAASSGTSLRNGGDGGTASGGDVNMTGSDGGLFFLDAGRKTVSGYGGAAAGGGGGSAQMSDADGGGNGNAGKQYGGGGAGGQAGNSAGPFDGGDGSQGLVVVTEFYAP